MATITEKAQAFADLHAGPALFVMPNCWDVGSARMLAGLGAKAIATASAGLAGSLGLDDGEVGRDTALVHAAAVVAAVDIPVSADLENGYADDPEGVAETVRKAADTGLAGCSIEDCSHGSKDFYDFDHALARVEAAIAAVNGLGRPFILTARADGILAGAYDVDEGIRRVSAFAEAGAGCVFVPGIPEDPDLARLCATVSAPVSYLAGIASNGTDIAGLAERGVRRVSTGPFLFRGAMAHAFETAERLLNDGETAALKPARWGDASAAIRAGRAGES